VSKLELIVRQFIVQQDADEARQAAENRAAYDAIAQAALEDLRRYLESVLPIGALAVLEGHYHVDPYSPGTNYTGRYTAPNVWLQFEFNGGTYQIGRHDGSHAWYNLSGYDRHTCTGEHLWAPLLPLLAMHLKLSSRTEGDAACKQATADQ
jgi:hypothetical protein